MALHTLEPDATTLHGAFSREFAPILTIEPGDTVRFRTLDAAWNLEPRTSTRAADTPRQQPRPAGEPPGHALVGPVAIRGAEPGMTLGVCVDALRVGAFGYTAAGGFPHPVNDRLGVRDDGTFLLWTLDPDAGTGVNQHGHRVALDPFLGVMGVAPAEPGLHSTIPPRATGGNLDCKELRAGSTLYLPIAVPGALFSCGDGHARQGDGEAGVTAIECPMAHADLTFTLHPELRITSPRARTPRAWITFGFDEDLDEAAMRALDAMLDLLQERFGVGRREALGLASVVVDLRVTQLVNGVRGVHAMLPHGAVTGGEVQTEA